MSLSRRDFLLASGSAATALAAPRGSKRPIGVQLYTVRDVLPQKPVETLRTIEQIGYREVEVVGDSVEKIWPALQQTSLRPVSVHFDTQVFTTQQSKLPPLLADAKKRGFRYVVCPYIAQQDRGGPEVIKRLAENLNRAGKQCREAGLSLCYHNHAFEFEPAGNGTLLDVLMQAADPKLVSLELDIMWAQVAGHNPVDVIRKYGRRVALVHLKNVASGIEKRYNEGVPRTAFREVGNGVIDVPKVLEAGASVGVAHYFVEQDQTPGDPLASLRQSFDYLSGLGFFARPA